MSSTFNFFRRKTLTSLLAVSALAFGAPLWANDAKELRIGFQKSASLLTLLKSQGTLERELSKQNIAVKWVEFPAGPQLLEGLNVGSIDFGYVGEAPPVFAQAAGANFVYVGYEAPAPGAEGLVVPANSPIKTVADLKGKKIALNKGSNVHYQLVKLLEKNGLKYSDIQPVFIPPADARAAFERGSVDAWVIWDPFLAAVEKQTGARLIADGKGIVNNHSFFLAERKFAEGNPALLKNLFTLLSTQGKWIQKNTKEAAKSLSPLQGLETPVIELSLSRYTHDVRPITEAVLTEQQKIADTFYDLKLIPKAIQVKDAWLPAQKTAASN